MAQGYADPRTPRRTPVGPPRTKERLHLDEREVSACAWLDHSVLELIHSTFTGPSSTATPRNMPATIEATVLRNGSLVQVDLPVSVFMNNMLKNGEDVEGLCKGTKYGMQLWLDAVKSDIQYYQQQ